MRERGSISLTTHTTTSGSHTSSALEEVEEVEEEEDGLLPLLLNSYKK
jgi:hypothetical protein